MFAFRLIGLLTTSLVLTVSLHAAQVPATQAKVDSLAALLPEKLTTIVDKTLDDQFAQIEKLAAHLPNMDKKTIFLITLPMENYIEDVYFPANKPVTIYPRVVLQLIYEEFKKGKPKKEIARMLVKLQRQKAFEKLNTIVPEKKK
ncbi:MAG: hypothetical protein ACE5HO_15285 [bacterium]